MFFLVTLLTHLQIQICKKSLFWIHATMRQMHLAKVENTHGCKSSFTSEGEGKILCNLRNKKRIKKFKKTDRKNIQEGN